jgi:hypothetical protein
MYYVVSTYVNLMTVKHVLCCINLCKSNVNNDGGEKLHAALYDADFKK